MPSRLVLSEWRTVLVSQTYYPVMFEHQPTERRSYGRRIISRWQEQVREFDHQTKGQWSNHSQRSARTSHSASNSHHENDRSQINRILREVGLNPADYALSPRPDDQSLPAFSPHQSSAFAAYSPRASPLKQSDLLKVQNTSLIHSARSLTNVQQPPPPPTTQQQQPAAPPPPPLQPPPPTSAPSFPSFLNYPPSVQGQNQPEQQQQPPPPQNAPEMHHHSFSPRRTPPPPPSHFSSHPHESSLSAEHYLRQINSQDVPPVKVVKPSTQNLVYRKEIRIRYLQPPTPPPPAPIIIREKHAPPIPAQSPLLIRERKPEARTPPPLTIRERPPTPPAPLEPYVIEKNIPPLPPPPRQIIVERLPTPPPKPRTVIFEKWLPYKKVKRPVLLEKAPPLEPLKPVRNVIIEYEPLKAFTVRRVIEEGVFRVDPRQYDSYNHHPDARDGDVRLVERIEDLPPPSDQLRRVLDEYQQPIPASSAGTTYHHDSEHLPPSIQRLLADARPASNADHLASVSRASSAAVYRPDRVLSTGYESSIPSPSMVPLERSRSKHSYRFSQQHTPRDTPERSHPDDIY